MNVDELGWGEGFHRREESSVLHLDLLSSSPRVECREQGVITAEGLLQNWVWNWRRGGGGEDLELAYLFPWIEF